MSVSSAKNKYQGCDLGRKGLHSLNYFCHYDSHNNKDHSISSYRNKTKLL